MEMRRNMAQMHAVPPMIAVRRIMPPPMMMHLMHEPFEDDADDEEHEDPFSVIKRLENERRKPSPGFFHSGPAHTINTIPDDHALEVKDTTHHSEPIDLTQT